MGSTVSADRLAAARAALDEPRPEAWKNPKEGEELAGTVVRTEEGDLGDEPVPIVIIDTGDGLRAVWCFHDALRSQLNKLEPQPGDVIAIRYNGKQQSASGRFYHSYTVASDKPRRQFVWDQRPQQQDTASMFASDDEDGDGYGFDDGEPLPPEPGDEPRS
jgi:hypothetical protein